MDETEGIVIALFAFIGLITVTWGLFWATWWLAEWAKRALARRFGVDLDTLERRVDLSTVVGYVVEGRTYAPEDVQIIRVDHDS